MSNNKKEPFNPSGNITKVSDEELANLHLKGWGDKYSIQANVEMSRRLKNEIKKLRIGVRELNRTSRVFNYVLVVLTIVLIILTIIQIYLFSRKN